MPLLINHELINNDPWVILSDDQSIPDNGSVLLSFTRFSDLIVGAKPDQLNVGVMIDGSDDIQAVIAGIEWLKLVVVHIPTFTDGRGFSFARMLRRAGYEGEIRATGDVTRDRLAFLQRCGFNAFDIAEDRYSSDLEKAFTEISVHYQGADDDPNPIYRQSLGINKNKG
ncbi:hypothetical protein ACH42_12240 [Endozoicomonas sp. (ex Bugula neritina AB1)]|nr:hypothetical protein ACH42_12240 [Endozoicomonas sp. (ex Bugula neritina AB1)]